MMLPIAIIDLVIAYSILRNVTERTYPKLDVLSVILSTFGFDGLLFGCGTAGDAGWSSAEVLVPLIVGAVSLVVFIRRQLRLEQPILEFRVPRYRMVTLNTVLGMCVFSVMIGGMMVLPLYMQNMNDFSAVESGLALLPGAAVMGLMSPVTGRIFDSVGAKWLAIAGFTLLTVTSLMFAGLKADTSFLYLAAVKSVRMVGVGGIVGSFFIENSHGLEPQTTQDRGRQRPVTRS